jgi:hypothetical protein
VARRQEPPAFWEDRRMAMKKATKKAAPKKATKKKK